MQFYSTNRQSRPVSLREAVLNGMPADRGLYMPELITPLSKRFLDRLPGRSLREIAVEVTATLAGSAIDRSALREIVDAAFTFDAPLRRLSDEIAILELFHGPTLAFKDFAAQFMAGLMGQLVRDRDRDLHILVATSGDTGGAVASGFFNTPGIHVHILFPSGKVSAIQEKQLTTHGGNISTLEVDGTFDDCQALVKQAFLDEELRRGLEITSANSINIARMIPQTLYYFRAFAQLSEQERARNVVISVPSGNFGNLTAGLIARRMGLPVSRFIAATNANDSVPRYLQNVLFEPMQTVATCSNAMDVGDPSNFARMLDLYAENPRAMRRDVHAEVISDLQTTRTIQSIFEDFGYLCDPHSAVGYAALRRYMAAVSDNISGIFLGTAHPAKFVEIVEAATGVPVELPQAVEHLLTAPSRAIPISASWSEFREYLAAFAAPH